MVSSVPTPIVSVITPTFNHEIYLGPCIESVLAQTMPDWEMIVLDDGSTDGTEAVARSFKDSRITYIRQERKGLERLAETYNRGLSLTHGPLIAVLEGDDMWPRDKLEIQVRALQSSDAVLCYGVADLVDRYGNIFGRDGRLPRSRAVLNNSPRGMILTSLLFHNFIASSTVIVRREALEHCGGFLQAPGGTYVDYPTYLRLSLLGEFLFLDDVVGFWRRHVSQHTSGHAADLMRSGRRCAREFYKLVVRDGMMPFEVDTVKRKLERFEKVGWDYSLFLEGRALLLTSDWPGARNAFWRLLVEGRSFARILGLPGIFASVMRRDLERLVRFAGIQPWR